MNNQYYFDFAPRLKMKVSEVQTVLKKNRVFFTPPSRETLIGLIEDGTLEGVKIGELWFIYADSFDKWVKSLDEPMAIAA